LRESAGEDGRNALDAEPLDASIKVLVAEDNRTNQLVLKTIFNQIGVQPVFVDNGAEAVERWRLEGDFDVILMDVRMPVLAGPDASLQIREIEARTGQPRTPIIGVTANAMPDQIDSYLSAGMDGVVTKPIDIRQLFAIITAVLDGEAVPPAAL